MTSRAHSASSAARLVTYESAADPHVKMQAVLDDLAFFDTGITTSGVALCCNAGLRTGVNATEQEITDELVDTLLELALGIDGPPPLSALIVVTP